MVVVAAAVAARTVHAVVLAVGPVETPAGVQVVVVDKLAVEEVEGLVRITEEDLGRVVALQVQGLDLVDAQVVVETVVDVVENISDFDEMSYISINKLYQKKNKRKKSNIATSHGGVSFASLLKHFCPRVSCDCFVLLALCSSQTSSLLAFCLLADILENVLVAIFES